ncbi:hypothetical protein [Streptomyces sp. NPDC054975]
MDTAMITMVAGLLGSTNAFAGWLIHLAIALTAGTTFGVVFGHLAQRLAAAVVLGLFYGAVWWTLGALWIMPANMGMPVVLHELADRYLIRLARGRITVLDPTRPPRRNRMRRSPPVAAHARRVSVMHVPGAGHSAAGARRIGPSWSGERP